MSEHQAVVSRVTARIRSLFSERPWPVYPVLVGAYFVLFLYSVNLGEAELGDLLPVLVIVVLLTSVALLGLGLILGNLQRAALALTAVLIPLFAYGHVQELLKPVRVGPTIQQLLWLIAIVLLLLAAWRIRGSLGRLTSALNVIAAVLVIVTLVVIAPYQASLFGGTGGARTASIDVDSPPASGTSPDIVYIVFDRYPSERSLELNYGIENDLYDKLRERGFYVADRSHANYQRTSMSLASTLSAELLDKRGRDEQLFGPTDMSGPYSRIQNSNVARFLKSRGYDYVHIGSDFSGTQTSPLADVNPRYDAISDFGTAFIESTAIPGIARRLGLDGPRGERRYNWTQWELDQLESLPDRDGPTFVFGHVLLPHTPYIFDRDGTFIPDPSGRSQRRAVRGPVGVHEQTPARHRRPLPRPARGRAADPHRPGRRGPVPEGPRKRDQARLDDGHTRGARDQVRDPQRLVRPGRKGHRSVSGDQLGEHVPAALQRVLRHGSPACSRTRATRRAIGSRSPSRHGTSESTDLPVGRGGPGRRRHAAAASPTDRSRVRRVEHGDQVGEQP